MGKWVCTMELCGELCMCNSVCFLTACRNCSAHIFASTLRWKQNDISDTYIWWECRNVTRNLLVVVLWQVRDQSGVRTTVDHVSSCADHVQGKLLFPHYPSPPTTGGFRVEQELNRHLLKPKWLNCSLLYKATKLQNSAEFSREKIPSGGNLWSARSHVLFGLQHRSCQNTFTWWSVPFWWSDMD